MNYAEDRLDRRARSSHTSSETGSIAQTTETTQDRLAWDLRRAHDVFLRHVRTETDDVR
eukprot:CAMPEP_0202025964 /NCGR_PEP_ID=MMETSP0905-20130828/57713_1 /ASSEMBLY_ACC=CAM_ASM_000554 /TAXON_ID=420261 /ORGANISM="Thalassiosira antarctica, Strain CCMP982" /LENGTH=58 /DNA_ID=CAMNT_0048589037 /DNA_START=30 /DNA_END=203 /DNA_ORIENTATION=+